MILFSLLKRLYKLIAGSKIIWKLVRHYGVLNESAKTIETVLNNLQTSDRFMPNTLEAQALLTALSNILKTGVIDLPGVDEYKLALNFDYMNDQFSIGIADQKSGKFRTPIMVKKISKKVLKPDPVTQDDIEEFGVYVDDDLDEPDQNKNRSDT